MITTEPEGTRPGPVPDPAGDAPAAVAALVEVTQQLWGPGAQVRFEPAATPHAPGEVLQEYLVLPHPAKARLLVPSGDRRAAAAAARSYAQGSGWGGWLARPGSAALVRSGAADRVLRSRVRVVATRPGPRPVSLEAHIRRLLRPDASVGVRVGSPRANRKPVLPVTGRDGSVLAYVKVGHNDLTRRLVATEGAALAAVRRVRPATFCTPSVLHQGTWEGLQVLAMSPLDITHRTSPADTAAREAMRELASAFGTERRTLRTSTFRQRLQQSLADLREPGPRAALEQALAAVDDRYGDVALDFGVWHGDWAPWNMSHAAGSAMVQVWDWERFERDVPLGFDALHHLLQAAIAHRRYQQGERVLASGAGPALAAVGVQAADRPATTVLYLATIALRYLTDAQSPTGEPQREIADWSLALLRRHVEAA